jgi:uncharacterized protein (UPF0333 family)
MDQKKFLVIILTLVVFASASFVLAQNSTSAKKDAVRTSASNDTQASPDASTINTRSNSPRSTT